MDESTAQLFELARGLAGSVWDGLPVMEMTLWVVGLTVAGLALGLLWAVAMQATGLLRRRFGWYHALLKLHFLVLPLLMGLLGFQFGSSIAVHRAMHDLADHYQPQLQALVNDNLAAYFASLDLEAFPALNSGDASIEEIARTLSADFLGRSDWLDHPALQEHPIGQHAQQHMATLGERVMSLSLDGIPPPIAAALGVDQPVLQQPLDDILRQGLDAGTLTVLVKDQVDSFMKGGYIINALLLLLLAVVVWGEVLIARLAGWHGRSAPPAPSSGTGTD